MNVEVYYDPSGFKAGRVGCYKARLANNHRIWDAGGTVREAMKAFVMTAKSSGMGGNLSDYSFKNIGTRCDNPSGDILPNHLSRR